jgi:hypothetical protein
MNKPTVNDTVLAVAILGAIGSGHRAASAADREAFRRGIRVTREEIEQAIQALADAALDHLRKSGGDDRGSKFQ